MAFAAEYRTHRATAGFIVNGNPLTAEALLIAHHGASAALALQAVAQQCVSGRCCRDYEMPCYDLAMIVGGRMQGA